jgi:hypothetical protein
MKKVHYISAALIIGGALIISLGIVFYIEWRVAHERAADQLACGGNIGGGTITNIEGNSIAVRDFSSGRILRIIVGSLTNYYEPDLLTFASSSSIVAIGKTIAANGVSCTGDPPTLDARMGYIELVPILPNISAPSGWYPHSEGQGPSAVFFTKQVDLPNIPSTEGYAYGEQIDVSAVPLTPGWATANIGNVSGTIGTPPPYDWGTLAGYQTIKAEVGTEAYNALIYAIFDPIHYTVYEFTLYPYPNATDTPILDSMAQDFAKSL